MNRLGKEQIESLLQPLFADLLGQLGLRRGDEHSQPRPRVEQAFTFQLGIDPGNRVRVDDQ